MVSRRYLLLMLILASVFVSCRAQSVAPAGPVGAAVNVEGGMYLDVTPAQLTEMLRSKDFFFVNTHIPYEGEIDATDAFIPYDEITQRLNQVPANKSARIVLYCRSGRMSSIAAEELVKAGYTDVWNLDGGMIAWEGAGLPLKDK